MVKKINRKQCLKEFPQFPLSFYNEIKDEDIFIWPKTYSGGWFVIQPKPKIRFSKFLVKEIMKLFTCLKFEEIIFLGDQSRPWISKLSINRNDWLPLKKALSYFKNNNVGKRFNGGLKVKMSDLPEFLDHFYCLVESDASLPYFHFIDEQKNILAGIHYSGDFFISGLSKKSGNQLLKEITNTKFQPKPKY